MKKMVQVAGCAVLLATAAGWVSAQDGPAATGHVLVKFRADKAKGSIWSWDRKPLATIARKSGLPAGAVIEESGLARWSKARRRRAGESVPDSDVDFSRFMYVRLPKGLSTERCIEILKKSPLVEYAEKDYIGEGGMTFPPDPKWADQWNLYVTVAGRIRAPEAWDLSYGSTGVIVAVLDTGCNTNLPDFAGRTVPGHNFVSTNEDTSDDHGHGTAVTGILCSNSGDGTNGVGVDWQCRLMPVKVLNASNAGQYSWFADGLDWAVSNGAKVVNLSAGGLSPSTTLSNAIVRAVSNGAIFVTITHNDSTPYLRFPGTHPLAIAVGANGQTGQRCSFSNYGTNIAIVAPGEFLNTINTNGVWTTGWWGTSFAAPQVAGVAALICAVRPNLNSEQVRALLCAGARDRVSTDPNDTPGYDLQYGWGVLDAYNSLQLALTESAGVNIGTSGQFSLSWGCPNNASNKQPYWVEHSGTLTGQWTTVTNGIVYGSSEATWSDTNSTAASRFYRVKVKPFPAQ